MTRMRHAQPPTVTRPCGTRSRVGSGLGAVIAPMLTAETAQTWDVNAAKFLPALGDRPQDQVGDAAALPSLPAEQQVVGFGALVVEMRVAVPGEADATVDLDRVTGDMDGRFAHPCLRHRRTDFAI